jgi:predicted RNase H-like HicB family nuclease
LDDKIRVGEPHPYSYVPLLPGCKARRNDIDNALANIQEAIELYFEPVDDEIAVQEGTIIRELVL